MTNQSAEGKEGWFLGFFGVSGSRPRKVNPEVVRTGERGLTAGTKVGQTETSVPSLTTACRLEVGKSPARPRATFLSLTLCLHHRSLDVAREEFFFFLN